MTSTKPDGLVKHMRWLHVLSQTQVTGAEVFAATIANGQVAQGDQVWIVSDTFQTATNALVIHQPIHNRKYKQRWANIQMLRELIQKHKIDGVIAHSRAASWVCFFAVMGSKVPLLSIVHGRQHIHTSTQLFDMYGDGIFAVCDELKLHLLHEAKLKGGTATNDRIQVVRNAFDFSTLPPKQAAKQGAFTILIAGRTTGPKGQRTGELITICLEGWLKAFPHLQVAVAGGPITDLSESVQAVWESLASLYPERCHWLGFVKDLPYRIAQSQLVIGSGRVAIEAAAMGIPTLALGEARYDGPVWGKNLTKVIGSNFGDMAASLAEFAFDLNALDQDVRLGISSPVSMSEIEAAAQVIKLQYSLAQNLSLIQARLHSLRMNKWHPKHIPVLMYHKVPDADINSQHKIYVPKAVFKQQMTYLAEAGYQSITFEEYHRFKTGELPLTQFPKKPIILSFDDGYADVVSNAWPIMQQYGFKGVLYPLADQEAMANFWDQEPGQEPAPFMQRSDIMSLQAAGWEIGSHTFQHLDLSIEQWSEDELMHEITGSKRALESEFGRPVITFCYPYGRLNNRVKAMVRAAGYLYAVAIDQGGLRLEDDTMSIFRAYIFPQDKGFAFKKKTATWYRSYFFKKRGR